MVWSAFERPQSLVGPAQTFRLDRAVGADSPSRYASRRAPNRPAAELPVSHGPQHWPLDRHSRAQLCAGAGQLLRSVYIFSLPSASTVPLRHSLPPHPPAIPPVSFLRPLRGPDGRAQDHRNPRRIPHQLRSVGASGGYDHIHRPVCSSWRACCASHSDGAAVVSLSAALLNALARLRGERRCV